MFLFLQMRLMRMERELEFVRSDRDRNELYLTRILKEVDQKVRSVRRGAAVSKQALTRPKRKSCLSLALLRWST